ncbi:Cytoplasmic and mitochondrial histidine tRNA synthetase [Sporothrix stenoceras]|uniref:histidine--tRNA ligase n=1 Tax=Sporothrix stenoceras TaxID=5173 RepID=A0ABR3YJ83_9PEZI
MSKNSLKVAKGTRDWVGRDLELRDHIFRTISQVLERHGAVQLDTPVFELREVLSEKYGEDSKLIYDLQDQGGESLSLRYDLTVPFARWLAMHTNVQNIKRYQIAKVYRRDQPAVARGRMREFYQCDFDVAGASYDAMVPDAEVIRIISEVFSAFGLGVTVKLNHRKVLDGLFAVAGVPSNKIRTISAAVDKLDKTPWAEVKEEMLAKGLAEAVADHIGGYAQKSGTLRGLLDELRKDTDLSSNTDVAAGLADLELLATYLEALNVADIVSFDLSLARGLDYYTGLIYEVVTKPDPKSKVQVGSIAAGGRYDNLVGMYGKRPVPCVGISFGVDRIFTILDAQREKAIFNTLSRPADVYIMAFGGKEFDGLLPQRMKVATQLWDAGIRGEYAPKVKPRQMAQFNASDGVPLAVILGDEEVKAGQVRVKRLHTGGESGDKDKGKLVSLDGLVEEVRSLLDEAALDMAKIGS